MFCSSPEPIKSPTLIPRLYQSNEPNEKRTRAADIELQVQDPYDELLSLVLEETIGTGAADSLRFSPFESQRVQSKAESGQVTGKPPPVAPAVSKATGGAGSVQLEVQFHKPVMMEPLAPTWGDQAKSDAPVKSQEPPSVKGTVFTELFIEEEDEALDEEEEEEKIRSLSERLSVQVEHGVSLSRGMEENTFDPKTLFNVDF